MNLTPAHINIQNSSVSQKTCRDKKSQTCQTDYLRYKKNAQLYYCFFLAKKNAFCSVSCGLFCHRSQSRQSAGEVPENEQAWHFLPGSLSSRRLLKACHIPFLARCTTSEKMCQSRTDDKRGSWGRCCSKPRSLMPNTDRRLLHAGLLLEATTVQSARRFLTESTCRDAAVATLFLLQHARVQPQTGQSDFLMEIRCMVTLYNKSALLSIG